MSDKTTLLTICLGSSCFARGNREMVREIEKHIKENQLSSKVHFKGARCFGQCQNGPFCKIDEELIQSSKLDIVTGKLASKTGKQKRG
jgi:NADH:ubiquinone oxidoreductase subunit E